MKLRTLALVLITAAVMAGSTPASATNNSRHKAPEYPQSALPAEILSKDDFLIVYKTICGTVNEPYEKWIDTNKNSRTAFGKQKRDMLVLALDNGINQLRAGFGKAAIEKADAGLEKKNWGFTPTDLAAALIRFRTEIARLEQVGSWVPSRAVGVDFVYGGNVTRVCTRLAGDNIGPKPKYTPATAKTYSNLNELISAFTSAGGKCSKIERWDASRVSCSDANGTYFGGVEFKKPHIGLPNHMSSGLTTINGKNWSVWIKSHTMLEIQDLKASAIANKMGGALY